MKTQEEIEQLGKQSAQEKYRLQHIPLEQIDEYGGEIKDHVTIFIKGYTKCQEDMADKKYTEEDLMNAFNAGINNDYGNGPSFDQWLNSLNKQDNEHI